MTERVLVSSLTPASGGVSTMNRFILDTLKTGGFEPVLGYYEPYGMTPMLSTPFVALGQRRPGVEKRRAFDDVEAHAIGTWLPELEFMHFRPGHDWKKLMDGCQKFVSVSGNVMAATPFATTGRPFLAWVAAGWEEDRKDRVAHFPFYRKILDSLVTRRVMERSEKSILDSGHILALSQVTHRVLNQLARKNAVNGILPMPIEHNRFRVDAEQVRPFRVGFSGRFNDPRKNIGLLLEAFARVLGREKKAQLFLMGGSPESDLQQRVTELGIASNVRFPGYLSSDELAAVLPTLDVFVVPSHQEGLCIAALEAMSCGVPVVTTRCGGPEEFVIDDETGTVVDFESEQFADAILAISSSREQRMRMGINARELVCERYSPTRCTDIFWHHFNKVEYQPAEEPN